MSNEENLNSPAGGEAEDYDLMMELDRLESLREDLVEYNLNSLSEVESALALLAPGSDPESQQRREALTELRQELIDLGLTDLEEVEEEIDQLNEQLDNLED